MKKKFVKSGLSARERKEMRRAEEERAASYDGRTEKERAEQSARHRNYFITVIVALALIITVAVAVPVVMSCNYMFEDNPVAVFEFESGGKIYKVEYEIFITDCPNAANNFIYLASIGFFDGTIVYDTQNEQVRIGGYDSVSRGDNGKLTYTHRSDDADFAKSLKDDFSPERFEDESDPTVFRYRLNKDKNNLTYDMFEYALCANVSGSAASSTEFQFVCGSKSMADYIDVGSGSRKNFTLETFAAPMDEEKAGETFSHILGLETYTDENGEPEYARSWFRAPVNTVTLRSVKAYNYDDAWKNGKYEYGFESFMTENGAFSSSWTKRYI